MAKTKTIELTEPLKDHRGLVKKIVLREPKFADLIEIGMPTVWVSLADGGGFSQETPSVIGQWVERLADIDPNFLASLCLRDSLEVRRAIIGFFIEAAMPLPVPKTTEDEMPYSPLDEPSSLKENGTRRPSTI